ncbi:MAG TPA: hypothetical protein PLR04_01820 [Bacilli bacterium]|nr:hypothetical protein [Bacilli bacterium]
MQKVAQPEDGNNIIEIAPIGKGRRILLFFADYFLSFIISFLLFNIAVVPLGYLITQYDKKSDVSSTYENTKLDILYGRELLYYHDADDKYLFSTSLSFTYDVFLSYYCLDDALSPDVNYPEYGHKIENDVIWTYYHDIKQDDNLYYSLFDSYNTAGYFKKVGDQYYLEDLYKQEIAPYFNPSSEISTNGMNYYDKIGQKFFFNLYGEVIDDIKANDITYSPIALSYKEADVFVREFDAYYKNFFTYTSIIAYFISWLAYFFFVPLFREKHQTIGMSLMKIQRLNIHRLKLYTKGESALASIYPLFTGASICFFLPMTITGLTLPFALSILIYVLVLSILFQIVSAIFIIFNSYNRTITDLCSQSVCVTTENLDAIYSIEEYNID